MTRYQQEALMPEPHVDPLPEPNDLPKGNDGKPLGAEATWTQHKGLHKPCDRCVRIIHQGLWNHHPHPGRMRRRGPNDTEVLCVQHAQMQRERDEKIKAHLAEIRKSQRRVRR